MIIYKDIFTGDELFSDTYKVEEFMGIFYKVVGKMINVRPDQIDDSAIGGNASAEGGCEQLDEGETKRKFDVADANRLQPIPGYTKATIKVYLKDFSKQLMDKLKADGKDKELAEYKAGGQAAAKYLMANCKDFEIFVGESMNMDGSQCFLNFEEDGITPYMLVFKHALEEEKV